jgi:hypothetical protein
MNGLALRYLTACTGLLLVATSNPVQLRAQLHEVPLAYRCYGCAYSSDSTDLSEMYQPDSYMGRDPDGVPHYTDRPFSGDEQALLREHFGIEDPSRLYLSDSSSLAYLVYDTERDRPGTVVMSHRVDGASVRQPGESWEELERRVREMPPSAFHRKVRVPDTSLASLHPVARAQFENMLAAARQAGFRVRVAETARSAERQAYLLSRGGGRTFTATSRHTEGWAVDLIVSDGNLRHRRTRHKWIAFRRWLTARSDGPWHIIGTPERSWDWAHIEISGGRAGFQSIEELLAEAQSLHCLSDLPRGRNRVVYIAGQRLCLLSSLSQVPQHRRNSGRP